LWETGALTIEIMAATAGKKPPKLGKTLNKATGKESGYETAFSEMNWGDKTRAYRISVAKNLKPESIDEIFSKAVKHYNEAKKRANKALEGVHVIDVDATHADERAMIHDD
jgi:hypothetical protein